MNNIKIFENNGLTELQFINSGQDILIEFSSSYNGDYIGSLLCKEIIFFRFSDPIRDFIDKRTPESERGFFVSYVLFIDLVKIEDFYQVEIHISGENLLIKCLNYEILLPSN